MSVDDLLAQLDAVRPRGAGKWSARCPVHADKNPSLSIREGERGILLRCFAGCSLDEICNALHLKTSDLFYDQHADSAEIRAAQHTRARERRARERQRDKDNACIDALKSAEDFIRSRRNIDISNFSNEQLDDELHALAHAYALIESETCYE